MNARSAAPEVRVAYVNARLLDPATGLDQHGAELGERWVAGGVVGMDVRIDEEADGSLIDAPDGRQHLLADLKVLRIDHEDTVRTREHTDPAASAIGVSGIHILRPRQHVQVRGDFLGLDLDLVPIDALGMNRGGRRHDDAASGDELHNTHHDSPP